ncbi:Kre5p CYBJADRAFT_149771 [Cyberlindnera jadinii NRRL Y-1542]|uniref:Uncharacterized protein n=1 Tax=Cyberlindnera jadinii (strain ATCC 18201 / CBS 1600 / BCRC 20928 / JCM 3617 / NBRC 0987 / NRRL Y-1542) TaxID=983966 RepID=A0A1E4S4R2_CYBJN|nr:hypothetical protein CYBJADRAFT_149771 [Cyberlindnera jadinii NRRL Y-1542]ODV74516.1 hypothetical protein CYBJADRAFT_149771 [Cyberlindnera jadinii NRRL Y-1542]
MREFLVFLLTLGYGLAQISIQLVANWEKSPFELLLLETVSSENESYFIPALSKVSNVLFNEEDDDEADLSAIDTRSDEKLFNEVFDLLTPEERSLYEIPLATKYYSPRIVAHYKYYNETILPKFSDILRKKCGEIPQTWLELNGVVYCEPDDVYALQIDKEGNFDQEPFDRVIGDRGPVLALYGTVSDPKFPQFLSTLYQSSLSGKLRFVWRYTPQPHTQRELLSGYGVDLTLKRTDYIVIDDRELTGSEPQIVLKDDKLLDDQTDTFLDTYDNDIKPLAKGELSSLDLKAASFVLDSKSASDAFNRLLKLTQDLPKFASYLSDQEINEDIFAQMEYNEKLGITSSSTGIFLNGAPLNSVRSNIFDLYKQLKTEMKFIELLKELDVDLTDAKNVIGKFALLSAYGSQSRGIKRYKIPQGLEGAVVYLNDIEKDEVYSEYSTNVGDFLKRFQFGEIPDVKANLHSAIFVMELSNKEDVSNFIHIVDSITRDQLSQHIGLVPLIKSKEDRSLANQLYKIYRTGTREDILEFLKYLKKEEHYDDVDYVSTLVEPFVQNFDVKRPCVIVNGVFYDLHGNWASLMSRQVFADNNFIAGMVYQRSVATLKDIKEKLYEDSLESRNLLLVPSNDADVSQVIITPEFVRQCEHQFSNVVFTFSETSHGSITPTLTFGANFGSLYALEQLSEILKSLDESKIALRVRLVHTGADVSFIGKLRQASHASLKHLSETVNSIINEHQFNNDEEPLSSTKYLLDSIGVDSQSFILLNGRYIDLKGTIARAESLKSFYEYEMTTRLKNAINLINTIEIEKDGDISDWFESFSSVLSASYFNGENRITRFDFSRLQTDPSIKFGDKKESLVNILAVFDPINEYTQKLLPLVGAVKDLPFVSVDIVLVPQEDLAELGIKRFYRGNIPKGVSFKNGSFVEDSVVTFNNVPEDTLFTLDMDVHPSWIVMAKEGATDLDNVLLKKTGTVTGIYELENIIIEGNLFDYTNEEPPAGLSVSVPGSDTNVMMAEGYFQLKANPGLWELSLMDGNSRTLYTFVDPNTKAPVSNVDVDILTIDGVKIRPQVKKNPGKESISLNDLVTGEESKGGILSSWFGGKHTTGKHADINIFTVASGHLYERLLSIMTVSVMRHTKHTVKFWLIDNYMSPTFREFLPYLAEQYGFEYELITYKWPSWLRGQREKQRTIWGYKILFLDVLFPQSLDKVIFIDADQIVRTDMNELVTLDLEGAPYGYTPMGDSRKEMEGFRFWKHGYWEKLLGDDLKYHISALYVIDLKKFRSIYAGDILRQQYQILSADPESLSNLDQDLPNSLQRTLKIFSLPQDWLWCETWCDDASLKTARTIDLCNNPLTKEPKLDRARRQIPEWTVYDDEISALRESAFKRNFEAQLLEVSSRQIGSDPAPIEVHDEL